MTQHHITAQRVGLGSRVHDISFEDGSTARIRAEFFRAGGQIRGVDSQYVASTDGLRWSLRNAADGATYSAHSTGVGTWSLHGSGGSLILKKRPGSGASLISDDKVVAEVSRSGFLGRNFEITTDTVEEPLALLALIVILAARRKAIRTVAIAR